MPNLSKQLGLALLYATLTGLSLKYFSTNGIITHIYLPSGFALAALLIGGRRYVLGIFLGTIAGSFLAGNALPTSATIAATGTLEAFLGFWLISRTSNFNITLPCLPDYMRLIAWGAFIPAGISAMIGVKVLGAMLVPMSYCFAVLQWWMSNALGIILITPLILVWRIACRKGFGMQQFFEAALIFGLTVLAGQIIFLGWFHDSLGSVAYGFWVFLFSLWAATRLGTRGTTIVIIIVAVQGLFSVYGRVGFLAHDLDNGIPDLYASFVLVYALVSTSLATYIAGRQQAERILADRNYLLRAVLDAIPASVFWKDQNSRYLGCNRIFSEHAGLGSPEDIVGLSDDILPWAAQAEHLRADDRTVMQSGEPKLHFEEALRLADGRTIQRSTSKVPLFDADGNNIGVLGAFEDITERKLAENDLRIAAITFESQEGILITDSSNTIIRVNSAFTQITGYTPEDVLGKNPSILKSGRQDAEFYKSMWNALQTTGAWEGEVWNRRKDGAIYPEHLNITAVKDQYGAVTHYVASLVDISTRKAAEEDIRNLAFYDPLTQLPNRRLLLDRLKQALVSSARSGMQGALLFIDLDNFKNLNDTLGHDTGDLLLQNVASRLVSCVREEDTVARLGGDEFVVMLEELSEGVVEAASHAELISNKILSILNQPHQLGQHNYHCTPSIGATLFNGHQTSIDNLLKQADIAMYQSKAAGRNTLRFFDPQMQASIAARVALENGLRQALANNEFVLHYQLQTTHTGEPVGAEALIRWKLPNNELMAPSNFIPLAEETGMIVPIGQWAMETACAQIKEWEKHPQTSQMQLAVNVSALQFHQADFVDQVTGLINRFAIRPDRLKLELTESLVLNDIEDTVHKMNQLRKLGVHFSMDDFGTGHSSLSNLKKLPLDQLKIDQSFVRDITTDPDDAAIVETIIAMARHLHMEIIAEGVETEAQRAFLEKNGCAFCQGYLFGKPMSAEDMSKIILGS